MSTTERICAAEGCENPVPEQTGRGRRFIYCSVSCRPTQQRTNLLRSLVAEIDHAEVTGNTRPAGRIWSVRLRRGTQIVTVSEGLGRPSADHLVAQITELIGASSRAKGGVIE